MRLYLLAGTTALLSACFFQLEENMPHKHDVRMLATDASQDVSPDNRRALFGETHLHTSYSFDAYGFVASRTDPDMAYRFAKGEYIDYEGMKVRRHDPVDFIAVTDHAEFMGVLNQLDDSTSYLSRSEFGRIYREQVAGVTDRRDQGEAAMRSLRESPVLETPYAKDVMRSTWDRQIAMANFHYRPGKFTTFIGYEWTSHPQDRYNLHRNVIFRGNTAPMPFSATDSRRPEDLWSYLEANRAQGIEALAIPHNGNASEGNMWAWLDSDGRKISADYGRRRAANEPLNEIVQGKGQSETIPIMSAADEFANFEVMDRLVPRLDLKGSPPGSYVRDALGRGLLIERRTGVNPYKFGAVGGTDFHNGLATSAENAFTLAFGFDPEVNAPSRSQAQWLLQEPAAMNPPPLILGSGG